MKRKFRRGLAAVCSLAMLASVAALPCGTVASAEGEDRQLLGETDFEYKMLPWHTVESAPAKQNFEITSDGELHITVLKAEGADKEKWDLELRHRNLSFHAGHTYEIEFSAKTNRAGLKLCSQIQDVKGENYYCVLDEDNFHNGPHSGNGPWGRAATLTNEWQTFKGTFTPVNDIDGAEWVFQYARGTQYEGNATDGDELWFDNVSIIEKDSTDEPVVSDYGYTDRMNSGLENNFISVNQLGYYPVRKKIAVLGDNKGSILYGARFIDLKAPVDFEVIEADSGKVAFRGTSSAPEKDADSDDTICKLDFSDFTTPGRYYIKSGDYRSFEFIIGDVYSQPGKDLLRDSLNYFYQNRSGIDIDEYYITSGSAAELAHTGTHKSDKAAVQKTWKKEYYGIEEAVVTNKSSYITANGGWYESGSNRKSMINGGMALWTLQNMYERASVLFDSKKFEEGSGTVSVPESDNKIPDILDEAAYELDWMESMRVPDDEPTWGESAAGLFYHEISDHKWSGIAVKPWDYIGVYDEYSGIVRIAKPPTFAATLNYAACAAQAARLWKPYDSKKAEDYLKKAVDAYEAYLKNYYEADKTVTMHSYYYNECAKEELNENSLYASGFQSVTGPFSAYGDLYVDDDAYWAACEIFVSASEMKNENADKFKKELEKFKDAYKVNTRVTGGENDREGSFTSFNWGNTASAGTLTLALHKDLLDEKASVKIDDSITKTADEYLDTEKKQGYGIPYLYDGAPYDSLSSSFPEIVISGYEFGSNGMVLNNAIIMAYAYDLTGDSKYNDGVTGAMDYLLGTNPLSFSFVTGYGSYAADNPNHRFWVNEFAPSFPKAPNGVAVSGPCAALFDPYVRAMGFVPGKADNPSQRCYADSVESWSTNETSLSFNASLAWVTSFLQDENYAEPHTDIKPTETPKPTQSPMPVEPNPTDNPQTSLTPSPSGSPAVILIGEDTRGDVDCNGIVDITDLSTLALALVDKNELKGQSAKNADVDKDGNVTLADLARMRQLLSKKIKNFDE